MAAKKRSARRRNGNTQAIARRGAVTSSHVVPRPPSSTEAVVALQRAHYSFTIFAVEEGTETEKDAAVVINGVLDALVSNDQDGQRKLAALRAIVDGAERATERWNADLVTLVGCVRIANDHADPEKAARMFVELVGGLVRVPLFGGLDAAAAISLTDKFIGPLRSGARRTAATGVVADLVLAAIERGVQLGHGATVGRKSSRQQVVNLVNRAVARSRATPLRAVRF